MQKSQKNSKYVSIDSVELYMKKFFITILVILALITAIFTTVFFGLGFFLSPQTANLNKADAIVVVSGGQTTTRAQKGIELYKQGLASEIIFSGAALDDGPSNASAMREQAISNGVPESAILIDVDSQNTYQNATNTKRLLIDTDAHKIILVTSPYHQRRTHDTFSAVLGKDYQIQNVSSYDDRWSKSQWWQTDFGKNISLSELQKLLYIYTTGNYQ